MFGFLAIADARVVFQYFFCIFNSIQGFAIFILHCVLNPRMRNSWVKLCGCEKCWARLDKPKDMGGSTRSELHLANAMHMEHRNSSGRSTETKAQYKET